MMQGKRFGAIIPAWVHWNTPLPSLVFSCRWGLA